MSKKSFFSKNEKVIYNILSITIFLCSYIIIIFLFEITIKKISFARKRDFRVKSFEGRV